MHRDEDDDEHADDRDQDGTEGEDKLCMDRASESVMKYQ
jgi:hypothetical protein